MLELKNITKEYTSGDTKVQALKGIDIEFRKSEFVSILGQSGCGKTTLLNIISMFLTIIASLIPAKMASKKDPVEALRTE